MQIAIIEDELFAVNRLEQMIKIAEPNAQVVMICDSVEDSVNWLRTHLHPQLLFMDIQLADGLSFQIFDDVQISSPVIFTTAFHEYTLDAFKVHSVDYLLKPIEQLALSQAINKYKTFFHSKQSMPIPNWQDIMNQIYTHKSPSYKDRFMVRKGNAYASVPSSDISIFYSENGLTLLKTITERRFVIDLSLEQIEHMIDPKKFFRANRKYIVQIEHIQEVHPYFNSRMLLKIGNHEEDVIVSRDKTKTFKKWMGDI